MTENADVSRPDGMTQVGGSFAFEVKSAPGGVVRAMILSDHEPAAGCYTNFHALTLEVNPGRWLPILRAMVAKCEQVVTTAAVAGLAGGLAERIEQHAAAT